MRSRKRLLLSQCFETHDECAERSKRARLEVESGKKKKKNHVGSLINESWKSNQCLEEVSNYKDGQFISFTNLAKTFDFPLNAKGELPGNAGQQVSEFLKANGVDIERFSYKGKGKIINRRSKKKI